MEFMLNLLLTAEMNPAQTNTFGEKLQLMKKLIP